MARVLGIDSAGDTISVAITENNELLSETTLFLGDDSLKFLIPTIKQVLDTARSGLHDIELITVTSGPGSWTGIRIGVETAKTISHVTNIPVVGVRTLDALAANITYTNLPIYSVLDGKKGNIISCEFDCSGNLPVARRKPYISTREELLSPITTTGIFIGDGVQVLQQTDLWEPSIHFSGPNNSGIIYGRNVCILGHKKFIGLGSDKVLDLVPYYMQESDAKVQWEKRNTKR